MMRAQTYVNASCVIPSGTSSLGHQPIGTIDGFLYHQLAHQAWAVPAKDSTQIRTPIQFGMCMPGQTFTFCSLNFIDDATGQFDINPPPVAPRALFFGGLEFIIDRYSDIHLHIPASPWALEAAPEHGPEPTLET